MNFDPQKFFVGMMDFFSILLPGALLTFLFMNEAGPLVMGERYDHLTGVQGGAAFLIASYLFGHLIFLLGSWLDEFYDWVRCYTLDKQIALLARRGRLLPWLVRALIWLVFKREQNLAVNRVLKIKQNALAPLQANATVNVFQWCKALLNVESPASLAIVQRFEADSKFFRCFTVVMLLLLVVWPWQHQWPSAGIPVVLGLLLLALWRYMEQRYKSTNQAYWSVITLTAKEGRITLEKLAPAAGSPSHAGGVVFRVCRGRVEYLLVEAKDDPTQWVLPKGHVEADEQYHETAIREVHEETGVWARIGAIPARPQKCSDAEWEKTVAERRLAADLGNVTYTVNGEVVSVRYYLMEAAGYGLKKEKDRRHLWLPFEEAKKRASHDQTRELLQASEQQCEVLKAAEHRRMRT